MIKIIINLCGGRCGEKGILSTKMVVSLPLRQLFFNRMRT